MDWRRLRFRVRGWLSDEEFKALLEFSRYIGRSEGEAVFEVDPLRVERSGYSLDDVVAILESLSDKIDSEDLARFREILDEQRRARVWIEGGWLYVTSQRLLKPIFEELGYMPAYDRERRAFRLPPHKYAEVVEALERSGLKVSDEVGLLQARLPREIEFRGELREYQDEALEAWRNAGRRGVIALPTGAGKTVIAIAALAELGVPTLIVVYTKEQIHQWLASIRRFTDAAGMLGAYYGDEKRLAPITVTTYQTAFRKLEEFVGRFAFLIVDEAHHLPAEKFRAIASGMPAPYRMALSATPEREDGKHEEIFPLMGGIVYQSTPGRLAAEGYLAPYVIRTVRVDLPPEKRREYETLRSKFQRLAAGRRFEELLMAAKKGDPSAIEALRIHARIRSIVQANEEKSRAAERIALEELRRGSKIIIFTQYKKQAEEIARRIGAYLLHGDIDPYRRKSVLEAFRRASSGVLVVTTVGDEGLDIPDANVGILVSGTGSRRQFIQRLGRLLRPAPGKKAVLYEIVTARSSEEYQARKRRKGTLA